MGIVKKMGIFFIYFYLIALVVSAPHNLGENLSRFNIASKDKSKVKKFRK